MMSFWWLIPIGVVLFYGVWATIVSTWIRLNDLGVKNKNSSTTFFDTLLYATIAGLAISRAVWMVLHRTVFTDIPWGILPYSRGADGYFWLTVFPWRFLRLMEGIYVPVLWAVIAIAFLFMVFVPTFELARKLRLEKRGIMRAFLLKVMACALISTLFFGVLTYISL